MGTSISTNERLHVQSFTFALDYISLDIAIEKGVFKSGVSNMTQLVMDSEQGLTRAVLNAGYKIDSLLV